MSSRAYVEWLVNVVVARGWGNPTSEHVHIRKEPITCPHLIKNEPRISIAKRRQSPQQNRQITCLKVLLQA